VPRLQLKSAMRIYWLHHGNVRALETDSGWCCRSCAHSPRLALRTKASDSPPIGEGFKNTCIAPSSCLNDIAVHSIVTFDPDGGCIAIAIGKHKGGWAVVGIVRRGAAFRFSSSSFFACNILGSLCIPSASITHLIPDHHDELV